MGGKCYDIMWVWRITLLYGIENSSSPVNLQPLELALTLWPTRSPDCTPVIFERAVFPRDDRRILSVIFR